MNKSSTEKFIGESRPVYLYDPAQHLTGFGGSSGQSHQVQVLPQQAPRQAQTNPPFNATWISINLQPVSLGPIW